MSGIEDLRIALETRLAAITSPLATQWENSAYSPIGGTPYQQVNLLLATPDNIETGRYYQQSGFMQISLRYPLNTGPGACMTRAQALRDWFYRGLSLAANGLTVTIDRTASILPAQIDGDRYTAIVRASFVANNVS